MSLAYPISVAAFAGSSARSSSTAASKPATAESGFANLLTAIQSEPLGQPMMDMESTVRLSERSLADLAAGQFFGASEADSLKHLFAFLSDVLVLLSGTEGSEDWEQWLLQLEAVLANFVPDMPAANAAIPLSEADEGSIPMHPAGFQQRTARLITALQQFINPTPTTQRQLQAEADSLQTIFQSLVETMPRTKPVFVVPSGTAGTQPTPIQQQMTDAGRAVQMHSEPDGTPIMQSAPRHPERWVATESFLHTEPMLKAGMTRETVPTTPTARMPITAELASGSVMSNEFAETQVQDAVQQWGSASSPLTFGPIGHARSGQPTFASEQAPLPRLIHMNEFPQEMSRMIIKHFQFAAAGELSEARILLHPEQLGHVDIRLSLHNGQLIAQFITETSVGKELLEQQIGLLRTSLQSQGIQVEKLEVSQYNSTAGLYQDQHHRQPGQHQRFQQSRKSQSDYEQWTNDLTVDADPEVMLSGFGRGNSLNVTA
jgi:flagellar hook-length control protein FliK